DLVAEAVVEDEHTKTAIFAAVGKVVRPDALITSNTSSIPIMKLAAATQNPERVIGMHFFNPAPVLPLVEIIPCELSSADTVRRTTEFARDRLGKTIITAKDRAGFVVNALLIPYLLAAIRMVDSGLATAEDIDQAMIAGCAHPMGPLALTDLIGLDTTMSVAESMYQETKEQLYAPPALLMRKVGRRVGPQERSGVLHVRQEIVTARRHCWADPVRPAVSPTRVIRAGFARTGGNGATKGRTCRHHARGARESTPPRVPRRLPQTSAPTGHNIDMTTDDTAASRPKPPWQRPEDTLGSFIRMQRQLAQLSLRELASMTAVSNAYLSQVERDLHQPSLKVMQSIADALGIPAADLLRQAGIASPQGD